MHKAENSYTQQTHLQNFWNLRRERWNSRMSEGPYRNLTQLLSYKSIWRSSLLRTSSSQSRQIVFTPSVFFQQNNPLNMCRVCSLFDPSVVLLMRVSSRKFSLEIWWNEERNYERNKIWNYYCYNFFLCCFLIPWSYFSCRDIHHLSGI